MLKSPLTSTLKWENEEGGNGKWEIFMKSINMEAGFFLWRVKFFKSGMRGPHVY